MKRTIALLLALALLLCLSACGKQETGTSIADTVKNQTATTTTPEPQPEPQPQPEPEPEPEVEMTTVEAKFFTVSFPTADGWTYEEEDDFYDRDSYSSLDMYVYDDADNFVASVRIYASQEDPGSYRELLYDWGIDEYALVEENAYAGDTYDIGGQQLLRIAGSDTLFYLGRNESAGMTLSVRFTNEPENERAGNLLEHLEFHVEETGNEDWPWYWEGESFTRDSMSTMVGTFTLNSEFIPMAEPVITHETFDHDIEIVGDKAYILSDGVLKEYAFDGASLTYVQDVALDAEYDCVDVANDGTLLLSGFTKPCIGWKDGAKTFSYSGPDYFAAAPDGTWGISYFTSIDAVEKYTFSGGAMQSEPFPVTGLSMATEVWIDDAYVYITGPDTENNAQVIQVYDHAGTLQKTLLGEDGRLGSITFVCRTANGFLALDGNMRSVVLWNTDGAFIGEIDDGDLFGTDYPWLCAADLQPDGSIVLLLTEDRDDNSAMELVAFRLTGF